MFYPFFFLFPIRKFASKIAPQKVPKLRRQPSDLERILISAVDPLLPRHLLQTQPALLPSVKEQRTGALSRSLSLSLDSSVLSGATTWRDLQPQPETKTENDRNAERKHKTTQEHKGKEERTLCSKVQSCTLEPMEVTHITQN